jgi:hypothetical protein
VKATILDSISREVGEGATRRGFLRLLGSVSAGAVVGAIGVGGTGKTAAAKRRGRKRGQRNTPQTHPQQSQDAQYELYPVDGQALAATSIPPNCIYVCCDGTCDSWKMCLKCVKWPKGTTTAGVVAR